MPFGLQPWHLIVIAIVALVVFGPRRLPEIGHGIGKALTEFRKGAREMSEGFRDEVSPTTTTPMPQPVQPAQYAPLSQYPEGVQQAPQTFDPGSAQTTPSQPVEATGNFCVNCGASNPAGARFCNNCGQQVNAVG